jgi:hypothetical protein
LGLSWSACRNDEADSQAPLYRYNGSGDFCSAVAAAACTSAVQSGCGVDAGTCITALRQHCNAAEIDASRRLLGVGNTYRGDRADACANAVGKAHTDGILTSDEVADITAQCDVVFSPRSPLNGTCKVKADCDDNPNDNLDLDCFFASSSADSSGTCTTIKPVGPGEACSELGAICQDPNPNDQKAFFCNGQNCVENVQNVSEPCSPGRPCGAGDRCLPDPNAAPGAAAAFTCQPKKAMNTDCEANEECLSGICGLRLLNAQPVRQCLERVQLNNIDAAACGPYQRLATPPAARSPRVERRRDPQHPGGTAERTAAHRRMCDPV